MPVEEKIEQWIQTLEKVKGHIEAGHKKRATNVIDNLLTAMKGTMNAIIDARKPKTIADGLEWVKSRGKRGIGTWLALLDENNNLLKMTRLTKELVQPTPIALQESKIQVEMTKRVLACPALEVEKAITSKVKAYEWIQFDGKVTTTLEQPKEGGN